MLQEISKISIIAYADDTLVLSELADWTGVGEIMNTYLNKIMIG